MIYLASTNKTANLGLSQWEAADPFTREDLNGDFGKIDEAAFYLPVKLVDLTVEEETQSITFDFSDKDLDQFGEIVFYADLKQSKNMRINGIESESYYGYSANTPSSNAICMALNQGTSRLSVTGTRYIYHTDYVFRFYSLNRTVFPKINTLTVFGEGSDLFSAGDRISIWGIRR